MKTRYTVALSMLAGAGLGAAAIQGLHAQAKPPVYLISEIDVTNVDAYAKEYVPKVRATIKAAGGRLLGIPKGHAGRRRTAQVRVTINAWDNSRFFGRGDREVDQLAGVRFSARLVLNEPIMNSSRGAGPQRPLPWWASFRSGARR